MTTLTTVLQTIATNPMVLQNPTAKIIFNKILETAGSFSPVQIQQETPAPTPADPNTQGGIPSSMSPKKLPTPTAVPSAT